MSAIALMTEHAWARLDGRRIPLAAVEAAFSWGRRVFARGAEIFVLGRKEVAKAARFGADLARFEGIHVVCAPDGTIVTAYRNSDLRALRPRRRGRRASR
ncbi:DUF4258 domain-containing protein [bacterium]|nr:DUF4258 domain-containing protein [bacterium]